jgi:hypothetical protein
MENIEGTEQEEFAAAEAEKAIIPLNLKIKELEAQQERITQKIQEYVNERDRVGDKAYYKAFDLWKILRTAASAPSAPAAGGNRKRNRKTRRILFRQTRGR